MRTVETTVYKFNELDERAKERARDWYREGALDHDWWEFVYEDAATIAAMFGFDINKKPIKLMNGSTRYEPAIYFSGFSSQGDGACCEGDYSYKTGSLKAVKQYAPEDMELHAIVAGLQELQRKNFYRLGANVKHRGHYSHSLCTEIDVHCSDQNSWEEPADSDELRTLLRSFMDWIYDRLRKEYEYQMADEQVDEMILANEYEFEENGKVA